MKRRTFLKALGAALVAPVVTLKALGKPVDPVPGITSLGLGFPKPEGQTVYPRRGKTYFVDLDKGNDRNTGRSPMEAIKDLNLALSRMVAVEGGEVYILP